MKRLMLALILLAGCGSPDEELLKVCRQLVALPSQDPYEFVQRAADLDTSRVTDPEISGWTSDGSPLQPPEVEQLLRRCEEVL